ncbi:MAG: transcriptional repressor [Atribacterota bacterium]|nr:transcriptional repressor [Atribacterota bacterium]MDD4895907.1 transcriptional repressor [Atribacterota bacterium]MDD5636531.1 transcriptional repressor [Atribacterota bacterium]
MEQTVSFCKEKLEQNGFRITPQRIGIFRCLAESRDHPSAEMVYQKVKKEFPNISFDTVNRTLLCLSEKGLIRMVESGYGPRRFDADLKNHYHFRCCKCKRIIDFDCTEYDNIKVPEDVTKRFKVFRQEIILEGICSDCIQKRTVKK